MSEAPTPFTGSEAGASLPAKASGLIACERCQGSFHCGAQDAGPWACTGLQLTPAQHAALLQHYQHCVCIRCLAEIAGGASAEPLSAR